MNYKNNNTLGEKRHPNLTIHSNLTKKRNLLYDLQKQYTEKRHLNLTIHSNLILKKIKFSSESHQKPGTTSKSTNHPSIPYLSHTFSGTILRHMLPSDHEHDPYHHPHQHSRYQPHHSPSAILF